MIRVGIFFGGASREREISFAGGRTVYDNLDKNLFEPIPVFVDSLGNFIELNWEYLYKGTIRDFYPPVKFLPGSTHPFQIYLESLGDLSIEKQDEIIRSVGKKLSTEELKSKIDFAFLSLHGASGEDGTIQGILEWLNIPYSGSGILPSAIGMNKSFQKRVMKETSFDVAKSIVVMRGNWFEPGKQKSIYREAVKKIKLPLVIRPANQGSSIGVSIIVKKHFENFQRAVDAAFFTVTLHKKDWDGFTEEEKAGWVRNVSEIKDAIGIPFLIGEKKIVHPQELLDFINDTFLNATEEIQLKSIYEEQEVLIEEFIDGIEFSCIVIRNEDGNPVALPPTEIKKPGAFYDYRSKYLAGMSRKVTPIDLPDKEIQRIRKACEELYAFFGFHVYARIDGFLRKKDKKIFLNDPNTTSGMLPSSFFFHQAAEIGLNPSQFLTYIIRTSIKERIESQTNTASFRHLLTRLERDLASQKTAASDKTKIAVILGGYSSERHISVESGRNVFEKLSSCVKYEPIPVFLIGSEKHYDLYRIPINLLLKDNADDICDKILHFRHHPVVEKIRKQTREIHAMYASATSVSEPVKITLDELKHSVKGVFIALHGRPGEDGQIQGDLDRLGIPYNGSGVASSRITINKYETNELLKRHGVLVANHLLMKKDDWLQDPDAFYERILSVMKFPFICKPVDDGCSSAVKKIHNREELDAFCRIIFRDEEPETHPYAVKLHLKPNEEFPRKNEVFVEELISPNGAAHFLEITGGMLTNLNGTGEIRFEVFEPSEALSSNEVLSLEEKFLAGEGQNITPARFADSEREYRRISGIVKGELEKVARILGVDGYCRIDAFVRIYENGNVETVIIEVNSLPGMTPATCIFHQAAINHYKPIDFIDKILDFSFRRKELHASH
jgi:D-alanine-D-alanine ligase